MVSFQRRSSTKQVKNRYIQIYLAGYSGKAPVIIHGVNKSRGTKFNHNDARMDLAR
jgi:hypothetical protein